MKPLRAIKTFRDRYPLIGPTMWILSVQYFLVQVMVAMAWDIGYSLKTNTISDLGDTACGNYGVRFVCSPLHEAMNISFIALGIFMASGSLLIYQEFKETKKSLIGFSFLALAGLGTILVGLFPENTIGDLHYFGALMPFLVGNLGLVVLSGLNMSKTLKRYTFISGFIPLIALILFLTHNYLGIGIGGMERIVAYPQTVWLIVFGIYISKNHVLKRGKS